MNLPSKPPSKPNFSKTSAAFALLVVGLSTQARAADVVSLPTMSLDAAKSLAAAAVAEARKVNAPGGAVAVVDAGGNLVYAERLDNTFAAAARISEGKARTAAMFRKPTRVFEESINQNRTAMAALSDFTPLQGGVPVEVDGVVIGGIGVSGAASAQQDDELAIAGASAAKQLRTLAAGDANTRLHMSELSPVPQVAPIPAWRPSAFPTIPASRGAWRTHLSETIAQVPASIPAWRPSAFPQAPSTRDSDASPHTSAMIPAWRPSGFPHSPE